MNDDLARELRAREKMSRVLGQHTGSSIFGRGGELNRERALEMSQGHARIGDYLDMGRIPFPPEPYGQDHASNLVRIAEYMAQLPGTWGGIVGGPLSEHDVKVIHAAAMLYTVGRDQDVTTTDARALEGFARRSADYADKFFREGGGAGTYWSKDGVREETCRMIVMHTRPDEVAVDKRLQVFSDALRYELCRFSQNTAAGMLLLQEEWKPEKFFSGWAREKANARQYMLYRGWK